MSKIALVSTLTARSTNSEELRSVLEAGQNVRPSDERFELVVIQPVKGNKGKLVFSASIHAENVSAAVRLLRQQIDGSGLVVLQKADFELPIINPVIADKMQVAYQLKYGS